MAVLMEMCMILCINAPHSVEEDEENLQFTEELRQTLGEGTKLGAKRFYIAGDFDEEIGTGDPRDCYGPHCLGRDGTHEGQGSRRTTAEHPQ